MSSAKRRLYIPSRVYAGCSWRVTEARRAISVFAKLGASIRTPRDRQFLGWYSTKSEEHLSADFTSSRFLKACGTEAKTPFVLISVCEDQILLVELLVLATNGECYDSNECRAKNLDRYPTPEKIAAYCEEFRKKRPRSGYQQIWLGNEGTTIREIGIREIFDASA